MLENHKRGVYTSEFWMSLVSSVVLVLFALKVIDEDQIQATILLLMSIVNNISYVYSRTKVKSSLPVVTEDVYTTNAIGFVTDEVIVDLTEEE